MGRPKGSLNKVKKAKSEVTVVKKYRKRGRPKGKVVKNKVAPVVYDMSKVKHFKFIGYCKCQALITTKELQSKFIYECPSCGKRARTKKLIKEIVSDRPKTKREYMSNTIHASHYESLPLNDTSLGPKDLKIQE